MMVLVSQITSCEEPEQSTSASVLVVLSPGCRDPRAFHHLNFHCPNPILQQTALDHQPVLAVLSRALNLLMLQVLHSHLTPLSCRFHIQQEYFNRWQITDIFLRFGVSRGKDAWATGKHSQMGSSLCSTLGCDVSLQNGEISFNWEKSWSVIPHRKHAHQTAALCRKP